MFEIKHYPELSWSLSRHKTMLECPRKYAYDYYISHNGWLRDALSLAKHTYRLKKITNLEMLFGSIVHDKMYQAIQSYLHNGEIPIEETLIDDIRHHLNQGFVDSTKKENLWFHRPKHYTMMHEIYYSQDNQLPKEKVAKINERLHSVVHHFLNSRTFQELQNQNQMEFIEAEQFRYMMVGDIKIFVVMDLVYRNLHNHKWVIIDWKTGKKSEEDRNQLALYALYLKQKFNIPSLDDIVIRNEYLLEGTCQEYTLESQDLANVQNLFNMSIQEMLNYLDDTTQNQPKPLEAFPMQPEEWKCSRCNYYELCFG
ncbi:PD-(D/E)XK nuclease family protein [Thalassobacillus sp. CUG 92003]|uniref:PD-(D/E)XK nuclease family protein n=1 Tax=Thalassobacillus sp. CUG 92003 TaxID=2736641 RepID=UPI0015E74202|nr:PD-(D/E)XK nuclease family protein [Thalassobacillus sp. CUG 92003]